jgi:SNF2 family DNA or RNA helicase
MGNSRAIIDNYQFGKLSDILRQALSDEETEHIRIAVGYLYMSGFKTLNPELTEFIQNGGTIDLLIGNTSQQGIEELVKIYNATDLVQREIRAGKIVNTESKLVRTKATQETYADQLRYEYPTSKNQSLLTNLHSWIQNGDVKIRIYFKEHLHAKAYILEKSNGYAGDPDWGIVGSSNLSFSGLDSSTELNAYVYTEYDDLREWFTRLWDEAETFDAELLDVINESWVTDHPDVQELPRPFLIFVKSLFELYRETLEVADGTVGSLDVFENLYEFQRKAVLRGIHIAEAYGGVIVADVVGMGKSYIGLSLLEHFHREYRLRGNRGRMLIIAPKNLTPMWEDLARQYRFNAEVISLGLVSQEGFDETLLNEYADVSVCLIDESHHLRNTKTNRYRNLEQFLPTVGKSILLTATPYTKEVENLYNQIKLFHVDDMTDMPINPPNLREYFKEVRNDRAELSTLLQHVMVRRTRQDIVDLYGKTDDDGDEFLEIGDEAYYLPTRHLKTETYRLDDAYSGDADSGESVYATLLENLDELRYVRYSLGQNRYLRADYQSTDPYQNLLSMQQSIRGLMKANLLKRLESSVVSFHTSIVKMLKSYRVFRDLLDEGTVAVGREMSEQILTTGGMDAVIEDLAEKANAIEGPRYEIEAFHTDVIHEDLDHDIAHLESMVDLLDPYIDEIRADPHKDAKVDRLRSVVNDLHLGDHPVLRRGDRAAKLIIFSQYITTVNHIAKAFETFQQRGLLPDALRIETLTGDTSNIERVITRFAPEANNATDDVGDEELDIIIATDVVGEGQNLQDASTIVNYDLHWNPLKLIQRIGRVDRLNTTHEDIYAVNFLPEQELESELGLVDTVQQRVEDIQRVMGGDGEILTEDEQVNQSFMKANYADEDLGSVETSYEEYGPDDLIGPASELRELQQNRPELIERVRHRDGIRSALHWDEHDDGVVAVLRRGRDAFAYLVTFADGTPQIESEDPVEILQILRCEEDRPAAEIDGDRFSELYSEAANMALESFKNKLSMRVMLPRDGTRSANVNRRYVIDGLEEYAEESPTSESAETYRELSEIVETVTAQGILNRFAKLRGEDIRGRSLVEAVQEIIAETNLKEKYEDQKEREQQVQQPAYVAAGMVLVGTAGVE